MAGGAADETGPFLSLNLNLKQCNIILYFCPPPSIQTSQYDETCPGLNAFVPP